MDIKRIADFKEYNENHLTKRVVFQKDESVIFVLNFMPGQQLPPHTHPGTQVYLLVLAGSGTMIADGKEAPVTAGDAINVDGDVQFAFNNTGNEPASLYVCLNKIPDERYAQNV